MSSESFISSNSPSNTEHIKDRIQQLFWEPKRLTRRILMSDKNNNHDK